MWGSLEWLRVSLDGTPTGICLGEFDGRPRHAIRRPEVSLRGSGLGTMPRATSAPRSGQLGQRSDEIGVPSARNAYPAGDTIWASPSPGAVVILALCAGVVIGLVLGALGGGGAILAVPALVYLLDQPPQAAMAGALVIVTVSAVTAVLTHARAGRV